MTTSDSLSKSKRAFYQGMSAAVRRLGPETNPYQPNHPELRREWVNGYNEGREALETQKDHNA